MSVSVWLFMATYLVIITAIYNNFIQGADGRVSGRYVDFCNK